ncbi:MAG: prepilin-type N-terminal cleavage/methylation domain-containing protein [Gemmatimonadaceae bacterium]
MQGGLCAGFTLIELLAVMALIGLLSALAVPRYRDIVDKARVAKAIGDIRAIQTDLISQDSLPASLSVINRHTMLDPWGRPYVYLKFPPSKGKAPPAGARRDKFLVPVNSEFDLYSLGKDGVTVIAFTGKPAHDDVVRANDGGYIGLAKNF